MSRGGAAASVAVKYAEAGDFERSLEAAAEIHRTLDKTFALAGIGVTRGKWGAVLSERSRSLLVEIVNSRPERY